MNKEICNKYLIQGNDNHMIKEILNNKHIIEIIYGKK